MMAKVSMVASMIKVEVTGDTLTEKLKSAMKAARNHWAITDEDMRFRTAVGAVMLVYGQGSDEYDQLLAEVQALAKFNAAIRAAEAGVSVDFAALASEYEGKPVIGLLKLWDESK
jgi:hypothetical protein